MASPSRPRVVVCNAMSIDGASTGFPLDIGAYYHIVGTLGADGFMAGSKTLRTGIGQFLSSVPPETEQDLHTPVGRESLPLLIVPDSSGRLMGLLHVIRQEPYYRDVVVFCSERTPQAYRTYLSERAYQHYVVGEERVDLARMLGICAQELGIRTLATDSGGELVGALMSLGLADELGILVVPYLAGPGGMPLFRTLRAGSSWTLRSTEKQEDGTVWLRYQKVP